MDQRPRHARVQDIADDGDPEVFKRSLVTADGEYIQHGLGGMGVRPVPGIDDMHMRGHMLGDEMGRAAQAVAHHKEVGMHGRQALHGVEQGFALGGA